MLVEYIFSINSFTLALIMGTIIFLLYTNSKKGKRNLDKIYEPVPVDYIKTSSSSSPSIQVMSYNILSYNFTKLEWFSYCQLEHLIPKYRAPRIINEIDDVRPDILCLQECDSDLFEEFYKVNLEAMGYTVLSRPSSSSKLVSIALAFKSSEFKLVKSEQLDLNKELEHLDESFQKHKEAQLCVLSHNQTKKEFLIVNTHLFWNPEYEYVRYGQIARILNHVQNSSLKSYPLIVCGDFNSLPNSNVLKYVYKQTPDFSNVKGDIPKNRKFIQMFHDDKMHCFNLRSAYEGYKDYDTLSLADAHPKYTKYTDEVMGTIDYMFYDERSFEVTDLLKVPTGDEVIKLCKLPNSKYPSDHLKIAARFAFK